MTGELGSRGPDPVCGDDPHPRYPPGEYEVVCVGAVTYQDPRFRTKGPDGVSRATWKCRLDCRFLAEPATVCGFFNMGNGPEPHVGRGSRYWKAWVMAHGTPPHKRQRPSKRTFEGKVFRVEIGDTRKDYEGDEHPEGAVYSTIKKFLACVGP
jgi:hypothetical protein